MNCTSTSNTVNVIGMYRRNASGACLCVSERPCVKRCITLYLKKKMSNNKKKIETIFYDFIACSLPLCRPVDICTLELIWSSQGFVLLNFRFSDPILPFIRCFLKFHYRFETISSQFVHCRLFPGKRTAHYYRIKSLIILNCWVSSQKSI